MGEITEALKRARRERKQRAADEAAEPDAGVERTTTPTRRRERPFRSAERAPSFEELPHEEPAPLAAEPVPRATEPPVPLEKEAAWDEDTVVQHIGRNRIGFWQARAVVVDPHAAVAERYRHLALQTRRELERRGLASVVITSAVRAEGKTVTACNLALALASLAPGRRVALLDLDLRRHSVDKALGIAPSVGIEAVLRGEAPLSAARVHTDGNELDVFPVRSSVDDAHALLSSSRLDAVVKELLSRYSLVVCDSPPVLPVPDLPLIVPRFGACLAVSRSGSTRRSSYEEMLDLIPPGTLLGSVVNDAPRPARPEEYDYYRPHGRADRRRDPADELADTGEQR